MVKIDRLLGNSRAVVCCKLIFDQITYKFLGKKFYRKLYISIVFCRNSIENYRFSIEF